MKLLPESARTIQAFLKIAKDEQELQEEDSSELQPTQSYLPYITNTVSTTAQQTRSNSERVPTSTYSPSRHTTYKQYAPSSKPLDPLKPQQKNYSSTSRPSPILHKRESHYSSTNNSSRRQDANVKPYSSTQHDSQRRPCDVCQRINHRIIDFGTCDGGHSSSKENPSTTNYTSPTSSTPIHIKVQVNNKQHQAIVDTGSAVTIINQQLLKTIYHKEFIHKKKLHKSANCSSINIIGEIQLEIKIQGYKTLILADVATNLITDLLFGNDWITANNVIIDSPQQCIYFTDNKQNILATAIFVKPAHLQLPVLLTDKITLRPHSEKYVNIKVLSPTMNISEALFEPAAYLNSKQILLTNALIKLEDNRSQVMILNANDRQKTLSKNTSLGYITYQSKANNYLILPVLTKNKTDRSTPITSNFYRRNNSFVSRSWIPSMNNKRKVQSTNFTCQMNNNTDPEHQCYVCQEQFLSRNDLQQHLCRKCYPPEMREQIGKLTQHIENDKQQQQLQQLLWKHGKLFDIRQPSIIKATVHHAIETGTHPPIYTPPYRVSYKDEQRQREEIDKLLEQGIIEESTSPWSSPIVLVRKKDSSVRFCIDFRKLNNISTKDAFPMPRIDDIFDHLSQAEYYTTIDFKSGYFQVGLDPKDRPKTAFSTRDQHYQFTVLSQGVTNGPPAFQRIVSQILGPTRWQYSLAYLDDVIIYSPTFDQHLIHLNDILNRLHNANFRLNVNKCQIAKTAIDFLGHHIEHSNIRPNADNIRALLETQQPTAAKEAFRFVKAAEYYRKFIPGFSTIAQPLYQYAPTTKEQRSQKSQSTLINLSDDEMHAFNELKRILTHDLVLRIPDQNLPFKIQTYASKIGIGAVLMQTHSNGDLPVAYLSKKFTTTQMNWPATEQECYAIICAIEKWHKYLDGHSFIIETDHKPLLPFYLKQQLNSKCERWRLKLQQYQFTIRYIKGKYNTVADYLSRAPVDKGTHDEDNYTPTTSRATQTDNHMQTQIIAPIMTRRQARQQLNERTDHHVPDQTCNGNRQERNVDISIDHSCIPKAEQLPTSIHNTDSDRIIPFTLEQIKELQHQDDEINNIIHNIKNYKEYFVKNNLLMKKRFPPVPVIPKGRIRLDIIKIYHDTPANGAHFGRNKTIHKIQQRYFWPNMVSDIRNYVQSCLPCLKNNPLRQKPPGALKPIKPPEGVWQLLTMDFHGPITPTTKNGKKYIILLTDVLSKFVITKAVRDCTALTAARFLTEDVILKYGTPKCILTDNGTHFTADMMTELFKKIGITHLYSTPYHPMTNGQIERFNATMDSKIATLSNEKRTNWDEQLQFVTFNYNTSIHATTGQIPFELMHGRSPILPFDQQQPLVTLPQDPDHKSKLNHHLSTLTEQARTNILKRQEKYKERYDQHRTNPHYKMSTSHKNRYYSSTYHYQEKSSSIVKSQSNTTHYYRRQHHYISPLEQLDKLTQRYCPGKFKKNNELKDLYNNGNCGKFELPSSLFKKFYINRQTSISTLNDLIDYAFHIKNYTIDTEDQLNKPPKPSDPALIQIQFIHENDPSIILLIEVFYLPPENSFTFNKIKQLCKIIFSPNHIINSWGDPKKELKKFLRFKLFDADDIDFIIPKNTQNIFKGWFNRTYPQSIHIKDGAGDQYSLQSAMYITFNEWLDKRMTLANWGCGIDLLLATYIAMNDYDDIKDRKIYDEKQIRQLMETYAINDCFSVTKLSQIMKHFEPSKPPLEENNIYILDCEPTEEEIQSNELLNDNDTVESVHVLDERTTVNDIMELDEPDSNVVFLVHGQTNILDGLEAISEGEEQQQPIQNSILINKEIKTTSKHHSTSKEQLTKTQRNNIRKRAARYNFKVTRKIYYKFTTLDIKGILIDMNIHWLNVNVINSTLYIGVKNEATRKHVENLLHDEMFTEAHYKRFNKKRSRRRKN
ncbi:unnamed protein product [Rotaria sordida]|uniref:RNA-directed DNA polymerase n=1 Tax=Rotaria sordida TaxID=392033 RepID=A0A815LDS9_9BILA|nr:unnamed protein product [Rotaria sordida]